MNAYITKINNYFVANKTAILTSLVSINLCLVFAIQTQETKLFGTIETPTKSWSTLTLQHFNTLDTIIATSTLNGDNVQEHSVHHQFTFETIARNEYIAYNPLSVIKFYRHRVYALDDKCYLSFRDSSKMGLHNASLRCVDE